MRAVQALPFQVSYFFARCAIAPAGARHFQKSDFLRAVQAPLPGRAIFMF